MKGVHPGGREGTVLESVGGIYRVLLEDPTEGDPGRHQGAVVEAFLRGRIKKDRRPRDGGAGRTGDRVVAGDRVEVRLDPDGSWTVEKVLPRSSELVRAGFRGRRPRVVAANLDRVVVVASGRQPELRPEQVDRFLALAESCHLEAVLVVNKVDLMARDGDAPGVGESGGDGPSLSGVLERYRDVGYRVIPTSIVTGEGLAPLGALLRQGTSTLIGPSGVGKSSLLNALVPGLSLRVGEVSVRLKSGRHTTVGSRLLLLPGGGRVVDTPGFSDVALWGMDPASLPGAFREFRDRAPDCRFRGCTHVHEPDCAVRAAVASGEIHPERYASYLALRSDG